MKRNVRILNEAQVRRLVRYLINESVRQTTNEGRKLIDVNDYSDFFTRAKDAIIEDLIKAGFVNDTVTAWERVSNLIRKHLHTELYNFLNHNDKMSDRLYKENRMPDRANVIDVVDHTDYIDVILDVSDAVVADLIKAGIVNDSMVSIERATVVVQERLTQELRDFLSEFNKDW